MKKIVLALLATMSFGAWGTEIELVYYHPPGGSADLHSKGLVTELERQGNRVNRVWAKSCAEAIQTVRGKSNSFLVSLTSDLRYQDSSRCPGLEKNPDLKLVSTLADTPVLFCSAPHRKDLTFSNLSKEKSLLIAVPTIDVNWIPFNLYMKNLSQPIDAKLVPYKGAGDLKGAVLSANVDLFYVSATVVPEFVEKGSKCFAASTKNNTLNLPFMGTQTKDRKFPETAITTVLWSGAPADTKLQNQIRTGLASPEYASYLKTLNSTHNGIGRNTKLEQMQNQIKEMDVILQQKP